MATTKTKGTNAKIKELKSAKPKSIDEKELNDLQSTIRTMDKLTEDVGRIEVQKFGLLEAMKQTQSHIQELREDFNKQYGTDQINIQTGEISYPESKLEENGEVNS
jgi:cell fate (sporulation/competence/biofilm development) regulator YmcA (YheA/YmcA/DUF963 family)